jgi:hypothetical protein
MSSKIIWLVPILFSISIQLNAQEKAVTSTGEEVILFDDGTWKYMNVELPTVDEITTNPRNFTKTKESSFLLKSKKTNNGFWINPKKWDFRKGTDNPDAEYELQLKEGDLYGMIITEKVEIPLEALKNIALSNAKSVAPDVRVIKEEYRNVNGLKVLCMQLDGTTQGIKFSYFGYYYSDESGTVQFITYTAQSLIEEYRDTAENLLNGIVLLNQK